MWRRALAAVLVVALAALIVLLASRTESTTPLAPTPAESTSPARAETERRKHDDPPRPAVEGIGAVAPMPSTAASVDVVVSAGGDPVAGASVELHDGALPPQPRATTDSAGTARFDKVPPGGLTVLVRKDGFVRVDDPDLLCDLKAAEHRRVEVKLIGGSAVTGIVVDADTGAPLVGARLVAVEGGNDGEGAASSGTSGAPLGDAVTGADGRFAFPHLQPQMLITVTVHAEGHARGARGFTVPDPAGATKSLEFRLPGEVTLRGDVYDPDDKPVAGARVVVTAEVEHDPQEAVSDARGGFAVGELTPGVVYDATARREGFAPDSASALRAGEDSREIRHDFRLRRWGSFRVHVIDSAGKDVAAAEVMCWTTDGGDIHGDVLKPPKAGPDGVLAIEKVLPAKYELRVKADGWPLAVTHVDGVEGQVVPVDVRLEEGVSIEGVVVDDRGDPVSGGTIEAARPYEFGPGFESLPDSEGKAGIAADGRFRVDGLRPGAHQLVPNATGGYAGEYFGPFDAPANGVRLVLERLAHVRFRVRIAEGLTAPTTIGWMFTFHSPRHHVGAGGGSGDHFVAGKTFDVPVQPVGGSFVISTAAFARVVRSIDPAPGATVDLGEIVLDAGIDVAGRVVGAADEPVAGAEVTESGTFAADSQKVVTGEDGAFTLRHLALGELGLTLRAQGRVKRDFQLDLGPGAAPLILRLPRGGLLRARAVAADGTPAKGYARVFDPAIAEHDLADGHQDYPDLDPDGRFEARLVAGHYRVEIHRDYSTVLAAIDVDLVEGEERAVTLRVPR